TEDAYITLRTVDNWVHGFGLRWNTDERVQGYTHPLWMLLLSAAYYVTREAFVTTIVVSMASTLAAVLVLIRAARSAMHAALAVTLLICSLAFVQFSTSGLENPLTHLLIAAFVVQYAVRPSVHLPALALTAALLALDRVDALLAVMPALLHAVLMAYRRDGLKRTAQQLAVGFSPLIAWELFSLVYYGFLVPNTAYAKLNTGLPRAEVLRQGATYMLNVVAWDPALLAVACAGVASAFVQKRTRELQLALGVVLYVLYVVWIGGDFMLGRFLTLPFFLAVCLLAISELPIEEPARAALVLLPFLFFYFHPAATEKYPIGDLKHSGVADERTYFRDAQLMMFTRFDNPPSNHPWAADGRAYRVQNRQGQIRENIGYLGFYAGPSIHIIDELALTDPLLARLPAMFFPGWRVGHYTRHIPNGYVQTVTGQECVMDDASLCEYYGKLREVTAGELWSWSRLKTIVGFNLGAYEHLIDRERYRYPYLAHVSLGHLQSVVAENAPWNAPGTRPFSDDGLSIELGRVSHAGKLSVMLDGNDEYTFEFRKGTMLLDTLVSPSLGRGFMHQRALAVPDTARRLGFDAITVRPRLGDGMYSIAQLRLTQ
ncbi:MAG: hypothetical protein JWN48_2815, partial [Myxococcaceae bacterium]|nr:hypothetical protein [Myxococcaceae bacterium]